MKSAARLRADFNVTSEMTFFVSLHSAYYKTLVTIMLSGAYLAGARIYTTCLSIKVHNAFGRQSTTLALSLKMNFIGKEKGGELKQDIGNNELGRSRVTPGRCG